MDVQVDPEQDQRPQDGREQGRTDLLQSVQIRPVMVSGRDDRPDEQVNEQNDADAGPGPRGCGCVVGHSNSSPPSLAVTLYPFPKSKNDAVPVAEPAGADGGDRSFRVGRVQLAMPVVWSEDCR